MENNSVLNEDSNLEDVAAAPRKSMSQPSLAGVGEPKKGLSNAFSASNVRSIPIIQTWHENEELKGQIYTLRCDMQMYERKYLEAKDLCCQDVKNVLDDYVEMKIAQDDWEQKMREYKQMEMDIDECSQQKTQLEQRIQELEAELRAHPTSDLNNTTCGSLRGTLDDIMKRNDPDFTLASGYDEKIAELEGKLMGEMDKVAELKKQVKNLLEEVIPFSETEKLIEYIDELEAKQRDATSESEKARLALVEYMNKCSKLENEIHKIKRNQTFDTSSLLIGQTSEELKMQITKVNGELNSLRAENRELRIRCHQLNGETDPGNLSTSLLTQSRLMAGISSTDLADSIETGGTLMRIQPSSGSHLEAELGDESELPLMGTSAAVRIKQSFDAAYDEYETIKRGLQSNVNDTLESSFNSSMPPPDRDATQSFVTCIDSPLTSTPKPLQQLMTTSGADQIQNHTKATASPHPPLLNTSCSPISTDQESPLHNSPGRLSDVQLKAAQNFEDLEVCQATLKKVEHEKAETLMELSRLEDSHHRLVVELDEAKRQVEKTLVRFAAEQDARLNAEEILEETKLSFEALKREQANAMMIEVDYRVTEAREQVEREKQAIIESLSDELKTSIAEENAVRDHLERMEHEMELLRRRAREAEDRVERTANEKHEMVEQIVSLEEKMEKEIEVAKQREDMVNEAIEGLKRIWKEVFELTKKTSETSETAIFLSNASSIRLVCNELCRRLTRERELQHESAQTMRYADKEFEQMQKENFEMQAKIRELRRISEESTSNDKENAPPPAKVSSEIPSTAPPSSSQKTSTTASNFVSPTRQLLHESTMAVDSIVEKLKETDRMSGMRAELKETIANLITESRGLCKSLRMALMRYKGIDLTKRENYSVDQLVEKLGQHLQDNLILVEQINEDKKELKLNEAAIPNLGADVQERIKREIGGIASDMGAVKALRNKK